MYNANLVLISFLPIKKLNAVSFASGHNKTTYKEKYNSPIRSSSVIADAINSKSFIGITMGFGYYPKFKIITRIRYIPHIFTTQELKAFFSAVDDIKFLKSNPARSLVMPVIFRLLYYSGLRPSEAVHLKMEDVDLNSGKLIVRQSKGNKDRPVVLSHDVLELFRRYNSQVDIIWPRREWFFPNDKGLAYTAGYISYLFRQFWNKTEITNVSGNTPRLYDMRHSFCVRRMNLWVKENLDLNALLPYLSAYMGHSSFTKTDYYLHLVPDFYAELIDKSARVTDVILPEVDA